MQNFLVFQALWAMEGHRTNGVETPLDGKLARIREAGFDGISADYTRREDVSRLAPLLRERGLQAEGQCFPKSVDDLKPVLENAAHHGVHHVCIQPDVRSSDVDFCLHLLDGWSKLAEEVEFPVLIETHRGRMTSDLHFTLALLDRRPQLPLLADLSHYVAGDEIVWPVSPENQGLVQRILDQAWAFHGRIASCEQIQISLAYPHHKMWLDQFMAWWAHGFRSWRKRAGENDTLAFVCELGPQPYAISGPDGKDATDRWAEALVMKDMVRALWDDIRRESVES